MLGDLGYRTTGPRGPWGAPGGEQLCHAGALAWVRAGGDLLYLCNGPSPFFWVQPRGGAYSGSSLTSFSWIRPAVHRRLQVANPLGLPFMHIMPHGTILGLPVDDPAVQRIFWPEWSRGGSAIPPCIQCSSAMAKGA